MVHLIAIAIRMVNNITSPERCRVSVTRTEARLPKNVSN